MSPILLVDLSALFWRYWHATHSGPQTYEFTLEYLTELVVQYPRMVICCEGKRPIRFDWFPKYKANREEKPKEAVESLARIITELRTCSVPVLSIDGCEADDVIATIATQSSYPVHILSRDKDLAALLTDTVSMLIEGKLFGPAECLSKFGVRPDQIRDFLALTGDASDNIPGCPNTGPGRARDLLLKFGTIDKVLAATDEDILSTRGVGKKTLTSLRAWDPSLAVKLVTLITDAPINVHQLFQQKESDTDMADMTLGAVVTGKQNKPLKIVAYGIAGIGKTRFGAFAPKPIFLCSEDGTASLDVPRFPAPETWADALSAIKALTTSEHDYKTLVIDSLDWLHPLVKAQVLIDEKLTAAKYEAFAAGEKFALKHFQDLIAALDALQAAKAMHVILLAHSQVKPFNNPEGENFDRYQLALPDKTAEKFKQWAYCLLFLNWESFAQAKDSGRARGVLGNRMICTEHDAAFDAKNRYGLPSRIPFEIENPWKNFALAMREVTQAKPAVPQESAA